MQKVLIAVSLSLVAGFSIGAILMDKDDDSGPGSGNIATDSIAPDYTQQIRALEQRLADEQNARRLLEEQVDALAERLDSVIPGDAESVSRGSARAAVVNAEPEGARTRGGRVAARMQRMQEWRFNRLVQGGYTEDEAQRLLDAESDAQLQAMQAEWEAYRQGTARDPFVAASSTQDILRQQLGDAEYERYLRAQGAPAAVEVVSVLDRSPGSVAGLQPGDEIVSYNGERTFSISDLRRLSLQGEPGDNVIVEIDRDGVRMQLSVPRGPIGMNGSGAGARGFNLFGG